MSNFNRVRMVRVGVRVRGKTDNFTPAPDRRVS